MKLMKFLAALLLAGGIAHAQVNNLTPGVGTSNFYTATSQSTGTNNAQIVTSSAGNFSLAAGNAISFVAGFTNSGDMTVNVDGTGNIAVHVNGSSAPAGTTTFGQSMLLSYNGSTFDVVIPSFIVSDSTGALLAANNLSDLISVSTARTNLGLGTAATQNIGTSGGTLGLLNANKTDSGNNIFSGTNNFTGPIQIGGTGVTLPVPVSIGGTSATTAWQARGALCPGRTIPSGASDTATTSDCLVRWNSSTASAKTETIPACNSGNNGFEITVTDEAGTAGTYNITVTPASGTVLLDTGYLMPVGFWSVTLRCDGANSNYTVI